MARGLVSAEAGATGLTFVPVESSYEETVCAVLRASGLPRVGIETAHMTLARYDWLERGLTGSGVTLCRTTGLVESCRQVKDEQELATMREAGARISLVMEQGLQGLRVGRTERDVAADIDWAIRGAGFEGPAFETTSPGDRTPPCRTGARASAGSRPAI